MLKSYVRNWFSVVNWQLVENKIRNVELSKRVSHHPEALAEVPIDRYTPLYELGKNKMDMERKFS